MTRLIQARAPASLTPRVSRLNTDAQAAAVVAHLGEPGFVAFSVVTALADAECRAALVDLPGLALEREGA